MTATFFSHGPSPWQHLFVPTNNIQLHCVTQGEGDLVILLHGFPEFWYSWRHQLPALARHFKVVIPDLRGYNDSDKPATGYDLDTLATDIRGLIYGLGYSKAHIVGHDWGGAIAWHMAQRFPQVMHRLAILNAPHPQAFVQALTRSLDQLWRSWYVVAFQIPGLPERLIRTNIKSFVQAVFQEQAVRKGAFTKADTAIYRAALEKPGVLSAAMSYYRQALNPQIWLQQWRKITPVLAPTLVLWGEDDSFLSQELTADLEALVDGPFALKVIPDCGHWIQQEVPQTVNRELLQFLRRTL